MASPETEIRQAVPDCETTGTRVPPDGNASRLRHVRYSDGKLVPLFLQSFRELASSAAGLETAPIN